MARATRSNTGAAGGPTSNCDSWPGDIIQSADGSVFFVNGWGNIYKTEAGSLKFQRLPGNATIARPSPEGSWDDLHQIEFTFLKPREKGGSWEVAPVPRELCEYIRERRS